MFQVRLDPALQELYIVSTVFNGPAEKAGLQVNDVIISIDGFQDLADLPISRIGTLLTGNMGSTVDIEVRKSRVYCENMQSSFWSSGKSSFSSCDKDIGSLVIS